MSLKSGRLHWLVGLLLVVAGCKSPPELKPPKQPDDYRLPPANDDRFSKPLTYPKDRFEQDFFKARQQEQDTVSPLGRPGSSPGGIGRPY